MGDNELLGSCAAIGVLAYDGSLQNELLVADIRNAMSVHNLPAIVLHRGVVFANIMSQCPDDLRSMGLFTSIAVEWHDEHQHTAGFEGYLAVSAKLAGLRLQTL